MESRNIQSLMTESRKLRESNEGSQESYTIWKLGNTIQLNYNSPGCVNRKVGQCFMCEYGHGRMVDTKEIEAGIQEVKSYSNIDEIVIGTCGSIFNRQEFSWNNFRYLVNCIKELYIEVIIFEVHYKDVTDEILKYIRDNISNKLIIIEMGFETSNSEIRINNLGKIIDNDEMIKTINKVHDYGFLVTLNILFGIPWLSEIERVRDCIDSINWAFDHKVNSVVVFPLNIKQNTLVEKLYNLGEYKRVSHLEFIRMLDRVDVARLGEVCISWFGDRQLVNRKYAGLAPYCKETEVNKIMNFYNRYLIAEGKKERKQLIKDILGQIG